MAARKSFPRVAPWVHPRWFAVLTGFLVALMQLVDDPAVVAAEAPAAEQGKKSRRKAKAA